MSHRKGGKRTSPFSKVLIGKKKCQEKSGGQVFEKAMEGGNREEGG